MGLPRRFLFVQQLPPTLILMPGMDGTGRLFQPLVAELNKANLPFQVVSYPESDQCDLEGLVEKVRERLPEDKDYVLIAESFSGPVAVALAATEPEGLVGLVLVASFLASPRKLLKWIPAFASGMLFRFPPPRWALRQFLIGRDADEAAVEALAECLRSLRPSTLSSRLKLIANVDVRREFHGLKIPVTYISGSRDILISKYAQEAFKNTRHIVVEAPHLILQRNPSAVIAAIQIALPKP